MQNTSSSQADTTECATPTSTHQSTSRISFPTSTSSSAPSNSSPEASVSSTKRLAVCRVRPARRVLVPHSNFGTFEENLSRSCQPSESSFAFIEELNLKTVIWLAPKDPNESTKLQHRNLTSILEEYRRFAGPKVRLLNEQFIEVFNLSLVTVPPPPPPSEPPLPDTNLNPNDVAPHKPPTNF
ncbi:hypothetical protein JCM16303_002194 [Sporobolomyces ruberrimus]